ncbi:putative NLI interacting factor like phosphatase [Trypanosoma vivax]|nr:putative NLI interacting factor like phosphatase [Trypanosoma vivax]
MPPGQRVRGASFKEEYSDSVLFHTYRKKPQRSSITYLIAPKESKLAGRPTVVLDLDETLVYARDGPLYVRPGLEELLQFLGENCETVLWTAGVKHYAEAVVRQIDRNGIVHHTICRDSAWFNGASCSKDLKLLGRDTATTIVFENTPDCIRGFEQNGVLVADYEGGELEDHTLYAILGLLCDLVQQRSRNAALTVPEFISTSHRLEQRDVPTDDGKIMRCYCLKQQQQMEPRRRRSETVRTANRRWNVAVH